MSAGIGSVAATGLKAAMNNMQTISNNIANSNTVGFKRTSLTFGEIYRSTPTNASTSIGSGVSVQSINQDLSVGRQVLTERGMDISIGNDGFFVQKDSNGQISYTRAGNLNIDKDGYLLTGSGRLQGYSAVNGQIPPSNSLSNLKIASSPLPAKATSTINLALNLDSASSIPANASFNPSDPSSYNYRNDTTLFDSQGNAYDMSIYYAMTANNTWNSQVLINGQSIGSGSLNFASNGSLASTTGLNNLSWTPPSGASSPQTLDLNFINSTQFSAPNSLISSSQDGYESGLPVSFTIDNNGNINASFSNGQMQLQGKIALAKFTAPQALEKIDNMSWLATLDSGTANIDQNNSINAINSGMLELSNVDLTNELINLMSAQHDFQANAQATQTYNQMLQTIENI